jgi:hypothetical protein
MTAEHRADCRYLGVPGHWLMRLVSADGRDQLGLATPRDISAGGALLVSSVALPVGHSVLLEPEHPHPLSARLLPFRVTRCEERDQGGYLLGGAFVPPLSDEDAGALARD